MNAMCAKTIQKSRALKQTNKKILITSFPRNMSRISGNPKNWWSRCLLSLSLVSASLHAIVGVQLEGNHCIIHCPSPQMYLLCFTSLFSQCLFFFFLKHWNNLIKTAKKPDVSVVKTSSVPVSHGRGLINLKCLIFKTFQSFALNFHF